jgi:hypothetical protein
VALEKSNALVDMVSSVESNDYIANFMNYLNSAIKDLTHLKKRAREEFSNPAELHISEKFFSKFGLKSYYIPEVLTESDINLGTPAYEALASIVVRIRKYTEKGFKIIDKDHVLVKLHSHILMNSLNLLNDPEILRIERRSSLASDKLTKKRVLFLNRMKILLTENKNALGIDYEDPEDNKIIPF